MPQPSIRPGLDFTAEMDVTGLTTGNVEDVSGFAEAIRLARDSGISTYLIDNGRQVVAIVPVRSQGPPPETHTKIPPEMPPRVEWIERGNPQRRRHAGGAEPGLRAREEGMMTSTPDPPLGGLTEPPEITDERIYDDLKAYQDGGLIEYVLPTEPLGEQWIIGWNGQILKFTTKEGIAGFLIGIQVATRRLEPYA
jgi:hypothetical protein